MKKLLPLLMSALIAAAIICAIDHSRLHADEDPPPDPGPLQQEVPAIPPTSADAPVINDGITIVSYDPNSAVSGSNDSGKADALPGVSPNQVVDVTVQFGAQKAGMPIQAAALDGGTLTVPDGGVVADGDGNWPFQFRVGAQPGLYQVALRDDTHEMGVQFWVINNQAPADNPPVDLPQ